MSINQLPNGGINEIPPSEPDPAQSAPGLSSTAAGDPGFIIDNAHGGVRFDSPSNPGATVPRTIRTGTWRVEEDGQQAENMLVPIPDEEPGHINTTSPPGIPPDSQESSHFGDEENRNHGGGESEAPQEMWYGGEEHYEETYGRQGRIASPTFLPLPPAALRAIGTSLAGRSTITRAREQGGGNEDRSRPIALTFLDAAGEIDVGLIPHAPRTGLPLPPPLVPLPRLTEEPPATWFEGMNEGSRCPVLSQPDYVVEYSFPCGHGLCRWCYEQICLVSDQPVCPLCRRRI